MIMVLILYPDLSSCQFIIDILWTQHFKKEYKGQRRPLKRFCPNVFSVSRYSSAVVWKVAHAGDFFFPRNFFSICFSSKFVEEVSNILFESKAE